MASRDEPFPFLSLPGEIRNRIYARLADPCDTYRPKSHHMPLLLSCRKLSDEYSSFVWKNATFVVRDHESLRRFTRLTFYRSGLNRNLSAPAHLALNICTLGLLRFCIRSFQQPLRASRHANAYTLFNPHLVRDLETLTIRIPCRTQPTKRYSVGAQTPAFEVLHHNAPHSTVTGLALIALLPYLKDIPEVRLEGCVTAEQKKTFDLIRKEWRERPGSHSLDYPDLQVATAAWMQLVKPPDPRDFPSLEALHQRSRSHTFLAPSQLGPSLVPWEIVSAKWYGLSYSDLFGMVVHHFRRVLRECSGTLWFCDRVDCVSKPGYDHETVFERNRLSFRI